MFSTAGRGKDCSLEPTFFSGIDWGAERHRICVMDQDGTVTVAIRAKRSRQHERVATIVFCARLASNGR
jgi:hypothetical protein